jgi:hypothetical protein
MIYEVVSRLNGLVKFWGLYPECREWIIDCGSDSSCSDFDEDEWEVRESIEMNLE